MKYYLLLFISFIFYQNNFGQEKTTLTKLENCILNRQQDSAVFYLNQMGESHYKNSLQKIVNTKNPSYQDYYNLIAKVGNRPYLDYTTLSEYINKTIKKPTSTVTINLDFVRIKCLQISKLRDETDIAEANKEQEKLAAYIKPFNSNDIDVQKANILSSTHQIVLYVIEKKAKKGKALCLENLKKARALNDSNLEIRSLYYICDFLMIEGDLEGYIKTCEKSLAIEKTLPHKSSYYIGTLIHILDAYIYKGGYNEQILSLLQDLSNNKNIKDVSYSLYAKFLGTLPPKSPITAKIYKQFEVKDLLEFGKKTTKLGKETLNYNDLYQLQRELANTHITHQFYKEGVRYMEIAMGINRKIYAEELSSSLASFKTKQAVKEKDMEIASVSEQNLLYRIIAALGFCLLFISVYFLVRNRKKSKLLNQQNETITNSFNEIKQLLKEKELLAKEVHHRVKNNFQIISSLLELQTKGIEDEKALELANEGQQRVKSMALIHQQLYQTENGLVDFKAYTQLLINELSTLYSSYKNVTTTIDIPNAQLDVDTAIPLGLIINELITNSYKYAFQKGKENTLNISIKKTLDNQYLLTVKDNGVGLSENINLKNVKSLGLRLVSRLTKQLHGTFTQQNNNGAVFEISFKNSNARKSVL